MDQEMPITNEYLPANHQDMDREVVLGEKDFFESTRPSKKLKKKENGKDKKQKRKTT